MNSIKLKENFVIEGAKINNTLLKPFYLHRINIIPNFEKNMILSIIDEDYMPLI